MQLSKQPNETLPQTPHPPIPPQEEEDAYLIAKTLLGDKEYFGKLIDKYWQTLTILVFNKVKNQTDTEDIVQECFIKAYKKLPSLREPKKFASWLYHIAHTTTIDWLRAQNKHNSLSLHEIYAEIPPQNPQNPNSSPTNEQVLKAVQSLPEKYQLVITLRYFKGMSYQEIAQHLNEPPGTISNRLHRANQLLRKWIQPQSPNLTPPKESQT